MATSIRELAVTLGLQIDAGSFGAGQLAIEAIRNGLGKVVEAAVGVASTFVDMIGQTAASANELNGLSQRLGVSTDSLQRMAAAANLEGVAVGSLAHGLQVLIQNMAAAKSGSEEQATAFRKLGIAVSDGRGHIRNVDEVFAEIIEKFSAMPQSSEKAALGFKIFGRAGGEMIEIVNNGTEALDAMANATVLTTEQIKAGQEIVKSLRTVGGLKDVLFKEAVGFLLPSISNLLTKYKEWKKANADLIRQRMGDITKALTKVVDFLGEALTVLIHTVEFVITNFWRLVKIFRDSPILLGVLITAISLFKATAIAAAVETAAAWAIAAAPFLLLGALIAGVMLIFDDIQTYLEGGDSLFGRWKDSIKQAMDEWMKPSGEDPWWLAALKDFVRLAHEAIDLVKQLTAPASGSRAGAVGGFAQRAGIGGTGSLPTGAVSTGIQMAEAGTSEFMRSGNAIDAIRAGWNAGQHSVRQSNTINVYPPAGSSPMEIASMVDEKINASWDDRTQAAHAALSSE